MIKKLFIYLIVCSVCFIQLNCNEEKNNEGPKYEAYNVNSPGDSENIIRFAIYPLFNPVKMNTLYQPLISYLDEKLNDKRVILESSRDYSAYEEKIRSGKPDILLLNAWQTLIAMKNGYEVIVTAGDPKDSRGIFIARKDSLIKKPADLKGKVVTYPSMTAFAACIMPQTFLYRQGIDVNRDITNKYVGSQESSIMHVYIGESAAGVTWPPPWRAFQKDHPKEAAALKVVWETPSFINNSVMVRKDLPAALKKRVKYLLVHLHETNKGRDILSSMETAYFPVANNRTYDAVRTYIGVFEKNIRKVESR